MPCPEFCSKCCHRKIPLDLFVGTFDVRKISQARLRDGNASSHNIEMVLSEKVLFHGKVGKMYPFISGVNDCH